MNINDITLIIVSIISTILLLLYTYYAYQNHLALKLIKERHFKNHYKYLRNIFIWLGIINILNNFVSWFTPLYWVTIFITFYVIYLCILLIKSKNFILGIQQYLDGETAVVQVEDALNIIQEKEYKNINDVLSRVEFVLSEGRSSE